MGGVAEVIGLHHYLIPIYMIQRGCGMPRLKMISITVFQVCYMCIITRIQQCEVCIYTVCVGTQVRRPTPDELMDPNGPYTRRQVDVSSHMYEAFQCVY